MPGNIDPDELLASLREGVSQTAIPSLAAQFIELDRYLRSGGPLPSDWWLSQGQRPSPDEVRRRLAAWQRAHTGSERDFLAGTARDRELKAAGDQLAQFIRELTGVEDLNAIAVSSPAPD